MGNLPPRSTMNGTISDNVRVGLFRYPSASIDFARKRCTNSLATRVNVGLRASAPFIPHPSSFPSSSFIIYRLDFHLFPSL